MLCCRGLGWTVALGGGACIIEVKAIQTICATAGASRFASNGNPLRCHSSTFSINGLAAWRSRHSADYILAGHGSMWVCDLTIEKEISHVEPSLFFKKVIRLWQSRSSYSCLCAPWFIGHIKFWWRKFASYHYRHDAPG